MTEFRTPRPIEEGDRTAGFDCGESSLDDWLTRLALRNEKEGALRTQVSITAGKAEVAGYYCLSAHSLERKEAPGALARNMPDPIPTILIGRLAVDRRFSGQGLGASLLQHAVVRSIGAADQIGIRAILVHALNGNAAAFYRRFGFMPFPGADTVLYLKTSDAIATVRSLS